MTSGSTPKLRPALANDIVGDRHSLVLIGMLAVWLACLVFGAARLVVTLSTGKLTPWWVNVAGAIAIPALYLWYRRRPQRRSPGAANGTALVATVALLVPLFYGMTSTVWWLGLVGFGMVLLGRRAEAWVWGVAISLLVAATGFLGPTIQLQNAAGEPPIERDLSRIIFVILLVVIAAGFRGVAEQRAKALHESDERYRMLFQRVPAGVFYCDKDLRITDCNERFADILGSDRESLIGLDMSSLADRHILPAIHEALGGASGGYEGPYPGPAGSAERFVSIRTVPVRGKDGSVVGVLSIAEDVTERRRMERELQRSHDELEQRVRDRTTELQRSRGVIANILNSIPQAVFWKDTNSVYLGCNQVFARTAGLAGPEDIVGKNDFELPWRDQAEALRADDREVIKTGRPKRGIVVTLEQSDGRRPWVITTKVPLTGQTGDAYGVLGVTEDITERKRAEEALSESEERYRSLFDQSPLGIYQTTPNGQIVAANAALLRDLGYSSLKELAARNLELDGYEPRYLREEFKEQIERDGEVIGFESAWLKKDGQVLAVRESARAVRDQDGTTLYYEGTIEDVTAQRRGEEERRRLVAAVEQASETIVITDTEGRIEYVNPGFERITGYTREAAIGKKPSMLKSGQHNGAYYAALWQTITRGETWQGHFINRRKDGSLYEEEATISPIRDGSGKIVNFVAVMRDVTQEVALQAQLRQAQKMEAFGLLAGGVAHDFNNLLQAMLNHVELARDRHAEAAQMATMMAELEAEIRRGSSLTRQLLLFARRETAKPEQLDLNEVIGSAATFLRRLVRANVTFSVELAHEPLPVIADRGQIDQVLMNLAVNAADAMPDGGRLTIRSGSQGREWVWFAAEDTGSGIPVEIRERIFEPFFTTKSTGKGTGLGLSVVHGIVTQHHGVVEFQDLPVGGTSFRITLPRAGSGEHPKVIPPAVDTSSVPGGHGERVLVVEDEEGARQGLAEILRMLEYDVVAVGSGEEAGALPHDPGFDVLLTDMMLPGCTGSDLARGLLERWPNLKVILMSGYTEEEAIRRGALDGRARFLQKPFDTASLAREIRAALDAPGT